VWLYDPMKLHVNEMPSQIIIKVFLKCQSVTRYWSFKSNLIPQFQPTRLSTSEVCLFSI
jgi:hypothetical protein